MSLPVLAADKIVDASSLKNDAEKIKLSNDHYWLALGHYQDSFLHAGEKSEIINRSFFIAQDGRTSPEHELNATIDALLSPISGDPNDHAQCRFTARYHWIKKQLHWPSNAPIANCTKYQQWTQEKKQNVSLIFATGYLKNPASFYGHVLLRFHDKDNNINNYALDTSLNYGAIIRDEDKGLTYIFKGLFGGYEAAFSDGNFYRYNFKYAESQLRNLWDYELDLTPEEVEQLSFHAWELLQARFGYYFVEKNCAYHMARLVELIINQPLTGNAPWVAPASIFYHLNETQHDKHPLVKKITFIPSRQSRYVDTYLSLTQSQKEAVKDWAIAKDKPINSIYSELNQEEKIPVVDTLLDYAEFRLLDDKKDNALKPFKKKIMQERLSLPIQKTETTFATESQPQDGDKVSMLQASLVNNTALGYFSEWRLRPAYFDLLNLTSGRTPFTTLEMFDFTLAAKNDSLWIRHVDLLNIQTLTPAKTGLPGETKFAWEIRGSVEAENISCWNCSIASFKGGIGKSYSLGKKLALYGMIDGKLQSPDSQHSRYANENTVGLTGEISPGWMINIYASRYYFLDGDTPDKTTQKIESRFLSNSSWDFRVSYEKNVEEETTISLTYKF